jgi:hypothetical protein
MPEINKTISIPGIPGYFLINRISSLGGGDWRADAEDSAGHPKVLFSTEEPIKTKGWQNYTGKVSLEHQNKIDDELMFSKNKQEATAQATARKTFESKYPFRQNQTLEVGPEAGSHRELGAFVDNKIIIRRIDFATEIITIGWLEDPNFIIDIKAGELATLAKPSLPKVADNIPVTAPSRERMSLSKMVEQWPIPTLTEYINSGGVIAKAEIFTDYAGGQGVEKFKTLIEGLGVDFNNLSPNEHYVLKTQGGMERYGPFAGKVFINPTKMPDGRISIPETVIDEVRPYAESRGSDLKKLQNGTIQIYNIPLFLAVVGMGTWS